MQAAKKVLAWVAPSLLAASVASLAIGALESLLHGSGAHYTVVTIGFIAILGVPIGLGVSSIGRLLASVWQLPALHRDVTDESGAAPRLAALVLVAAFAPLILAAAAHQGVAVLMARTKTGTVIALGAALVVGVVAVAVLLVARPAVLLATRLFEWIEAKHSTALLTPGRILVTALAIAASIGLLAWFVVIRPRIGHLNIEWLFLLIAFVVVIAAGHLAWHRFSESRWRVLLATSLVTASCALFAVQARYSAPATVLAVWNQQPLAGSAVETLFDIFDLGRDGERESIAPVAVGQGHPDILLITMDTVRADFTPPYGGDAKMPNTERLGRDGTVFEWAFSAGNVTRRSLATIATGLNPHRVRGRVTGWSLALDPRHISLAQRLRAAGYDTAVFAWSKKFFGPRRFGGGFDHSDFILTGATDVSTATKKWMSVRSADPSRAQTPLFTWVHFIEPHRWKKSDRKPPSGLKPRERNKWLYRRSLSRVDKAVGRVIKAAKETRNRAGVIIVLTSDHGEGLGEHGAAYHSTDLYNSQTRVPLIIAGPGIVKQKPQQPTGHADLVPTLLELAGYSPLTMPETDGQSLAGLLRGTVADDPSGGFSHSSMKRDRSVESRADAIVIGPYKYLETEGKTAELYDIRDDPDEETDLAADKPDVAARLKEALDRRRTLEKVSPFASQTP